MNPIEYLILKNNCYLSTGQQQSEEKNIYI